MNKSLMIKELIDYYSGGKNSDFANKLGVTPQAISTWLSRNTYDIELLFAKCENISPDWLLTGKGDMLISNTHHIDDTSVARIANNPKEGIPLIPISAMAGCFTGEEQILEYECERFVVPTFKGAEFLISVKGSSMYPKYNSGDIVACKRLSLSDIFFQWNKVYVLDTDQGPLIKRIQKGSDNDHILIVSENEKYSPFELHKSKLNAVAIVLGVIRLE